MHSLLGSVPGITPLQVPFAAPVTAPAHDLHEPVHVVLQQKPSTQWPLWHWWFPMVHAEPCGSLRRQLPPVEQK